MITDNDLYIKNTLGENAPLSPDVLLSLGFKRSRLNRFFKKYKGLLIEVSEHSTFRKTYKVENPRYRMIQLVSNIKELSLAMSSIKMAINQIRRENRASK